MLFLNSRSLRALSWESHPLRPGGAVRPPAAACVAASLAADDLRHVEREVVEPEHLQ